MTENKQITEISEDEIRTTIVSNTKTRKLKRKNNYNNEIQFDIKTIELVEMVNEQADRAAIKNMCSTLNS